MSGEASAERGTAPGRLPGEVEATCFVKTWKVTVFSLAATAHASMKAPQAAIDKTASLILSI